MFEPSRRPGAIERSDPGNPGWRAVVPERHLEPPLAVRSVPLLLVLLRLRVRHAGRHLAGRGGGAGGGEGGFAPGPAEDNAFGGRMRQQEGEAGAGGAHVAHSVVVLGPAAPPNLQNRCAEVLLQMRVRAEEERGRLERRTVWAPPQAREKKTTGEAVVPAAVRFTLCKPSDFAAADEYAHARRVEKSTGNAPRQT